MLHEWHMKLFVASVLTFVVSLGLTPIMRLLATRTGLVATPRDDRWNESLNCSFLVALPYTLRLRLRF